MKLNVTIKQIEKEDIGLILQQEEFAIPSKHYDRFLRQEKGIVLYLIVWLDKTPIGHALLKWNGAEEEEAIKSNLKNCPDIEDLFVISRYRSQGIGSLLLATLENLVKDRGFKQVGLSVGVENRKANSLYERFGYKDSKLGNYWEHGEYVDSEGKQCSWDEEVIYLDKKIE